MMPSPSTFDGDQPVSASTPREIRAALIGEEIAHFDREYRQAMDDAAESLDLSGGVSVLKRCERTVRVTEPGALEGGADAARVGEPRLGHPAGEIIAEHRFRPG